MHCVDMIFTSVMKESASDFDDIIMKYILALKSRHLFGTLYNIIIHSITTDKTYSSTTTRCVTTKNKQKTAAVGTCCTTPPAAAAAAPYDDELK